MSPLEGEPTETRMENPHQKDASLPTVLVVDDIPANLSLITELLAGQYRCRVATGGAKALAVAASAPRPDVILLDISMPEMDGYEVCRRLKADPATCDIPVIFLTALDSKGNDAEGFSVGGVDYIAKPVSKAILLARVNAQISLQHSKRHLAQKNERLEQMVRERGKQLANMQNVIILAMASLAETRNNDTDVHIQRIQHYTRALALSLRANPAYTDRLPDTVLDLLFKTCPLHDIGKVGVADGILFKPGLLLPDEFEEMKQHTILGGQALTGVERQLAAPEAFVSMAHDIALYHHERWDGSGYPLGIEGESIPLSARIVSLADTYDALTSSRVYRQAYSPAEARDIIARERDKQFEPALVDAFLDCEKKLLAIAEIFSEECPSNSRSHVLRRLAKET